MQTFYSTPRMTFAIVQILFGLVVPVIYMHSLTRFSIASASLYEMAYWLGLPAMSFVLLALLSLARRDEEFRLSLTGMWSAAIAGYLAFAIPAACLWFTTGAHYHGGGANIGVALIVTAMPIYLPVLMIVGFIMGESLHRRQKQVSYLNS
jgi:hypothetical protein